MHFKSLIPVVLAAKHWSDYFLKHIEKYVRLFCSALGHYLFSQLTSDTSCFLLLFYKITWISFEGYNYNYKAKTGDECESWKMNIQVKHGKGVFFESVCFSSCFSFRLSRPLVLAHPSLSRSLNNPAVGFSRTKLFPNAFCGSPALLRGSSVHDVLSTSRRHRTARVPGWDTRAQR